MNPIFMQTGGLAWPAQLLYTFLGLMLGLFLLFRHGQRNALHWQISLTAFFALILGGLVGGRLWVVLREWRWFHEHWGQIWLLPIGGMHLYGALLGCLAGIGLVVVWYGVTFLRLADVVAHVAMLAMALMQVGAFFQGAGFGRLTNLPFATSAAGSLSVMPLEFSRHPLPLYAALIWASLYLFFQLSHRHKMFDGQVLAIVLMVLPLTHETLVLLGEGSAVSALFGVQIAGIELSLDRLLALALMIVGGLIFAGQKSRRLSDL